MKSTGDLIWVHRALRFVECFFVELMLLICSASLSLRLLAFPNEAELCVSGHPHVIAIIEDRIFWGVTAAVACVLKIAGLACLANEKYWPLSMGCRLFGLFLSAIMWTIIGVSYLLDCPFEIAGLQMVMMGLSAGALKWTLNLRRLL